MSENAFAFNPNDPEEIQALIREYSGNETTFKGKNNNDEEVVISICHEKIVVSTYQHNGWIRKNLFYANGAHEIDYERRR